MTLCEKDGWIWGVSEWGGQSEWPSVCLGGHTDKRQLKDPPSSPKKKAEKLRSVGLLCTSLANPSPSTMAGQSAKGKVILLKAEITSPVKWRVQLITSIFRTIQIKKTR